jgi:uncharacterized pyridoxamine 5'-phosphate oxidase family protein
MQLRGHGQQCRKVKRPSFNAKCTGQDMVKCYRHHRELYKTSDGPSFSTTMIEHMSATSLSLTGDSKAGETMVVAS